jgi:magnesium chelatase accessory protein
MSTTPPRAWARDGADWPQRAASRFVAVGGVTFHVQVYGQGPVAFLVHGTGAATHSWRDLGPMLAPHFTVVAADLPGHGFTTVPYWHDLSLPGMARDLGKLLGVLGVQPVLAVGHSAGAAILARMCLDGLIAPLGLVSLNGAFMPFGGPAGQIFAPLARLLVGLPVLPALFSWRASDLSVVNKLLTGTGSTLDARGVALYAKVMRNPDHTGAALRMMASWDLAPVLADLPRLNQKVLFLAGETDKAIPPSDAEKLHQLVPGSDLARLPRAGHLAHEEQPTETAAIILTFARRLGAQPPKPPRPLAGEGGAQPEGLGG